MADKKARILNNFRIFDVDNDKWIPRLNNKALYENLDRLITLVRSHKMGFTYATKHIDKAIDKYYHFDLEDEAIAKDNKAEKPKSKAMIINGKEVDSTHKKQQLLFDDDDDDDEEESDVIKALQNKMKRLIMDDDDVDTDDTLESTLKEVQKDTKVLNMDDDDDESYENLIDKVPIVKQVDVVADKIRRNPVEYIEWLKSKMPYDQSLKQMKIVLTNRGRKYTPILATWDEKLFNETKSKVANDSTIFHKTNRYYIKSAGKPLFVIRTAK